MDQSPQKKAVIKNPYAKRKRPPANHHHQNNHHNAGSSSSLPSPAATTRYVATTFSQAFGSVHDYHDDYHDSGRENGQSSTLNNNNNRSQSQPQQASTADDDTTYAHLTDREAHVLLTGRQPHVLYVSHKQKGNAVLRYIRNVPTAFGRMVPDFILGADRCALFLSCRYHNLYPRYVHGRVAALGRDFTLRVLLVSVDVPDSAAILRQLNALCVTQDLTLILAWSEEEAARYLETLKAFDGKDATLIQKREATHFAEQAADFLSAGAVNKTDSAALLGQFGSMRALCATGVDDLALVPGMGPVKVKRLHDALHKPFSSSSSRRRAADNKRQKRATKHQEETPAEPPAVESAKSEEMPRTGST